jgi:hypothetical protein
MASSRMLVIRRLAVAIDPVSSAAVLAPHPTFAIARVSSLHGFAHSHDGVRWPTTPMTKMRHKMTHIMSFSLKAPHGSSHKFVNVMA